MNVSKKIFKTSILMNNNFYTCDTIFWQGKYWLVPEWLENIDTKKRQPKRIILVENLRHQKLSGSPHHFAVSEPIPKDIFDGKSPSRKPYQMINYPEVFYDTPEPLN